MLPRARPFVIRLLYARRRWDLSGWEVMIVSLAGFRFFLRGLLTRIICTRSELAFNSVTRRFNPSMIFALGFAGSGTSAFAAGSRGCGNAFFRSSRVGTST